ncbi:hypothetical protein OEZ86_010896 [Tetradesmus obliquus]|nr:hypothetical protein OEZ86_010896 [Tetradesmus obliquus]
MATLKLSTTANVTSCRSKTMPVVRASYSAFRLISRPNVNSTGKRLQQLSASTASPLPTLAPPATASADAGDASGKLTFHGVHHVALICENLERSLEFYQGVLGMEINPDRPDHKLPYRGAWLWIGPEMIHLMELPNPDPADSAKRPEHGGRDRHFCVGMASLDALAEKLDKAGITYTRSMSGRAAIFFRDPDANCLECVELAPWR